MTICQLLATGLRRRWTNPALLLALLLLLLLLLLIMMMMMILSLLHHRPKMRARTNGFFSIVSTGRPLALAPFCD